MLHHYVVFQMSLKYAFYPNLGKICDNYIRMLGGKKTVFLWLFHPNLVGAALLNGPICSKQNLATVSFQHSPPMLPSSSEGDIPYIQQPHFSGWDQGKVPRTMLNLHSLHFNFYPSVKHHLVEVASIRVPRLESAWVLMLGKFSLKGSCG